MIGTIRKHSQALWAVIITLTVISFVYFFSPDVRWGMRRSRSHPNAYFINDHDLTPDEWQATVREAKLQFFFRTGAWPDRSEAARQYNWDETRETNERLLMIAHQRELGIHVSDEATAKLGAELLDMLTGGKAPNAKVAFDEFDKQILRPNGLTSADFERYLRHEVGFMQLISLGGVAGRLMPTNEAAAIYRRENELMVAEAVFFNASNYIDQVTNVTPEALSQFYSNFMANYRIPERVQVAYARFELTNFLAEADQQLSKITNLSQQIDAMYQKSGPSAFTNKEGKPLPEAEGKEQLKQKVRETEALRAARKKAFELVAQLGEPEKLTIADLKHWAESNKLTYGESAPFDIDGPKDMKVPEQFAELAFKLSTNEPVFLNPIVGEDGVYIIGLLKKLPASYEPLDKIKDKVLQDYKFSQAVEKARSHGEIFHITLTNGLAQGKTFSALCLESKLKPIILPAFSRSTQSLTNLPENISVDVRQLSRIAFNLKLGTASAFTRTPEGGMILYLRNRLPADETKMATELPQFVAQLRMRRQYEAANEWLSKQRQTMRIKLPEPKEKK